jgi:hypothetical protein
MKNCPITTVTRQLKSSRSTICCNRSVFHRSPGGRHYYVSPFQGSDFGGCLAPGSASLHLGLLMVPALRACFSTSACGAHWGTVVNGRPLANRVTGHRLIIGRFLMPCNGNHPSCLLCGTPSACNFWGMSTQGVARFQRGLPWAGMFCAFSAENQRGDRKTQTQRPSCTKQPTLKKICANLRNLRIKNVCYQSLIAYQTEKKINQSGAKDTCCQ